MSFYNEIECNKVITQSLVAVDGIETPSITIGGVPFNVDVSGAVTLPYLEDNYLKKSDATVLQDISGGTDKIFNKKIVANNASIQNLTAPSITTSMNSTGGNNVPNISYIDTNFPQKDVTYLKTQVDSLVAPKLDTTSFNAYQTTVGTQLASKAPISSVYTTGQVDALVSNKLDSTTFASYQSNVSTALSGKINNGDVYTKSEMNDIVNGKVDNTTYASGLAGKVNLSEYNAYKTDVSNNLASKVDSSTYSSGLAGKVDNSTVVKVFWT